MGVAALTAVVVLVVVFAVPGEAPAPAATPQRIDGPAWEFDRPVAPELFGVTLSSATGEMPGFRVGSLRFWDSRTRWATLQPRPGEYDWSVLDRLVDSARRAGLPALMVFGGTPEWAAPQGPKAPYDDGSRAAPPDDLARWEEFVRAVGQRYRGRLEAYELWVSANDHRYFAGSVETLVEMTRRAKRILDEVDPAAVLVCPPMGRLWEEEGRAVLRRFAQLGGYDHCDVAGVKLHQRHASDPPETMLALVRQTWSALHEAGVHPRVWNTSTTYELPSQGALDERRASDYAMRFYLAGIYGTSLSLERMYFYNWGSTNLPIVLQPKGGRPTKAALAVEELQRWLHRTRTRSCGHGAEAGLPETVWQCVLAAEDGRVLTVRWTHTGTASTTAPAGTELVRLADGSSRAARAGDAVAVSETPVLVEGR
ncbi:beta-galactosidase [Crossiella cryophila]|uniref:Glycoside hydrolase family 42 N-terminal domain-containing protein n=1 Tax=Crossiella cryophila TaxID=43355 RepID=A0A7W7FU32_9PSEU|nr:beta-galactosidase [Crossiella cryophila]MBB4678831.1 hypothetical protein [Crossiella cryophila]